MRVVMISKALVVGAYQSKAEALVAADPELELTVIVPPRWGRQQLEKAHINGYTLQVEPVRFSGNFHLHHYPRVGKRLAELQPDIVHIDEEPYNLATFLALRQAKKVGARALFFSWQNINQGYPPPFSWMDKYVCNHADFALVGNPEAEQVWRSKGYDGPLKLVPQFGVDPDTFTPNDGPRPQRPFTIGFAGRLVPEKGVDIAIRAALGVHHPWRMLIAGEGPAKGYFSTQAGILNIGGQVEFVGSIGSTAMPDFYHRIDVLVLPSLTKPNWKEQFGRVLIEAMASGVPVVGSDSGAIPWVIGDAGLIVPEDDEEALRGALLSLIHDRQLYDALAYAGRQRVLEHFTQQHIAKETLEVYERLMLK